MEPEKKSKRGNYLKVLVLFVLSYALLYAIMALSSPLYNLFTDLFTGLNRLIPIFFIFQWLLDMVLPWQQWNSPLFFLMPVFGFFAMYFFVDWAYSYYNLKETEKKWFPVLFIVLGLIAYLVVLLWYYANMYQLTLDANPQWQEAGVTFSHYLFGGQLKDGSPFYGMNFNFWNFFKDSPFLVFMASALLGWFARTRALPYLESRLAGQ